MRDQKNTCESGSIREMASLTLPLVVSLSCDTLMIFTNRLLLSKISPDAMNASMGGGIAAYQCLSFFVGLVGYTTALVAQQYGAGQRRNASRAAFQAMLIALAVWPILACLGPFAREIFNHMGLVPEQARLQSEYFSVVILGSGFYLLRSTLSGFFCGIGRTGVVMLSAIAALVVNACVAWVLIFGRMGFQAAGVRGAAIGVLIGTLAGVGVLVAAYFKKENRKMYNVLDSFHYDKGLMKSLVGFGYPAGLELMLNVLAFNTLVTLLHGCGPATATAATILFNWDLISILPLVGIEIGVTSLVGRYMGARDYSAAHQSVRSGLKLVLVFAIVLAPFFVGIPELLVGIFQPQETNKVFTQAAYLAESMLRFAALYVFSNGILLLYAGALRGAGDTLYTMAFNVGMHWIMAGGMYVALKYMHATPIQGWLLVVLLFTFSPIILWLRWNRGQLTKREKIAC
ncbi:MAG: Multidrug resistance protein NorM [Syntrophus sp. SKADARSKE-3]|nr:Multidrug resistance protein NorM [Syntrophus sp. SKADARSKE-3]